MKEGKVFVDGYCCPAGSNAYVTDNGAGVASGCCNTEKDCCKDPEPTEKCYWDADKE